MVAMRLMWLGLRFCYCSASNELVDRAAEARKVHSLALTAAMFHMPETPVATATGVSSARYLSYVHPRPFLTVGTH
jgi:hypothetical protein